MMKKKDYIQFYDDNKHRAAVHKETFRKRVKNNMDWETALTHVNFHRSQPDEFYKYRDLAMAKGMKKETFNQRVFEYGMTYEEALETKVRKRYKIFSKELLDKAALYDIPWKMLNYYRESLNLTPGEAVDYAIRHYNPRDEEKEVIAEVKIEDEIKLLLKAGVPIRKKKYVDFINDNKELFEGMI